MGRLRGHHRRPLRAWQRHPIPYEARQENIRGEVEYPCEDERAQRRRHADQDAEQHQPCQVMTSQRVDEFGETLIIDVPAYHPATMLTSLPGTTMTFFTCLPARCSFTRSLASASFSSSACEICAGTSIRSRSLPLTCRMMVTVSSLSKRGVVLRPRLVGERLLVAEFLPKFLGQMRRVGREQQHERLEQLARTFLLRGDFVDEDHHLGNGGIERQRFRVLTDLLDGLMQDFEKRSRRLAVVEDQFAVLVAEQSPDAAEEAIDAFQSLRAPRLGRFERAHEHLVHAQRVRAVFAHHVVGIDDVAARLAHLLAVLAEDHALVDEPHERFGRRDVAEIEQHLVPEPRVEQVQHRVLRAADVEIDRHPVFLLVLRDERAVVLRIDVAQVVPARAGPLRHRVRLAFGRAAALRTFRVDPVGRLRQRRLGVARRRVVLHLRQLQRQFALRHRHRAVLLAMHDRNRLAPVPLPREQPVAQLVLHRRFAEALFFEPRGDLLLGFGRRKAGDEAAVDGDAIAGEAVRIDAFGRLDNGANLQAKLLGEFEIARVVRGHGHDRAGAVAHHHVIGDPDRNLLVVDRIDGVAAGEDAGLFLLQLRAFQFALAARLACGRRRRRRVARAS